MDKGSIVGQGIHGWPSGLSINIHSYIASSKKIFKRLITTNSKHVWNDHECSCSCYYIYVVLCSWLTLVKYCVKIHIVSVDEGQHLETDQPSADQPLISGTL